MKAYLIPLVVAALALQFLGCGHSGEATVAESKFFSTVDQFCGKATRIQASAYKRIAHEAAESNITAADGRRSEQEVADAVARITERMIREIETLKPPPGKEGAIGKMLKEYQNGAEETRANPQVYLRAEAFQAADTSAGKLGLTKCESM